MAEVFTDLFGPMNTMGFLSAIDLAEALEVVGGEFRKHWRTSRRFAPPRRVASCQPVTG